MDGVLVDYLSTWEWIYNKLGLSNHEAYSAFQAGEITEWDWIKYDLDLIRRSLQDSMNDEILHTLLADCPLMLNWRAAIQSLLDANYEVAIVSGGMQPVARKIAAAFPAETRWRPRLGGVDCETAARMLEGRDSRLHIFTNGWLKASDGGIPICGRYQVQLVAKGAVIGILQRRFGISKAKTVAIGDSRQDASMFSHAGFSIAFNTRHQELIAAADLQITEKNLLVVSDAILGRYSIDSP